MRDGRLRAVFERAMCVALATAPPSLASACSGGAGGDASSADAAATAPGRDARAVTDTDLDDGGSPDASWTPACQPGASVFFEGGSDSQPAGCDYGVPLPCGLPAWVTHIAPPDCYLNAVDCQALCVATSVCKVANGFGCDDDAGAFVAPDGSPILIECDYCPNGGGRRPWGLAATPGGTAADPVGRFLARSALLEAASVPAFHTLARELRQAGAPRALVESARRCARDEIRHARVMARLARARGCEPLRPTVIDTPPRSLVEVAIENEREGCVRETFGALVATWQAAHARQRGLAAVMSRIATDETRHAALAWTVASWLGGRIGVRGRRRVAEARREAIEDLKTGLASRPNAALVRDAGLPTYRTALTLREQLGAALWGRITVQSSSRGATFKLRIPQDRT
jgi:hypothetical protein